MDKAIRETDYMKEFSISHIREIKDPQRISMIYGFIEGMYKMEREAQYGKEKKNQ